MDNNGTADPRSCAVVSYPRQPALPVVSELRSFLDRLEADFRRAAEEKAAQEAKLNDPQDWSRTLLRELEGVVVKLGGVTDRISARDLEQLGRLGPIVAQADEELGVMRELEREMALEINRVRGREKDQNFLVAVGTFWAGLAVGAAVVILGTVAPVGWPLAGGIVGALAVAQLVRLFSGQIFAQWSRRGASVPPAVPVEQKQGV